MLYNSLLPHSPVLHCEEGVVLHESHVDHMFREGNAAQCLASFFEHLSKRSLHHEIIDQPKRIVSTSDTTTLSPASDTWESNLVLVIAVTVTDAREFLVREEKGSAAGSASPEAGACVSRLVPIPSNIYSDLTLCPVAGPPLAWSPVASGLGLKVCSSPCWSHCHTHCSCASMACQRCTDGDSCPSTAQDPRPTCKLEILGILHRVGQLRCGLCAKTYISRSYGIVVRTDKVA